METQPHPLINALLNPGTVPAATAPAGRTAPFALLRREGRDQVEVLTGDVRTVETLAEIPLPDATPCGPSGPATLAIVPYRQVTERGFEAVDDLAPLTCLTVSAYRTVPVADVVAALPAEPAALRDGHFDVRDDEDRELVTRVLRDEIGRGEGSNFVIHRAYTATVDGDPVAAALAAFGRLLRTERGAYWTFCVHTGERTYVGATPERHVSVDDGLIMMNPISGTYRHPDGGADREGLLRFLADPKETDELYMVLDEELKMMASVADLGGQVVGPYLKEMSHLTHTEYLLVGRGSGDVRDVLRGTMFAPTVVGSPIENACRVVARHERRGRGTYGGVLALLGHDDAGRATLDAPILIRYAEFERSGRLRVPVGATLVRHSVPAHEVAETRAKAAGVLAALGLHEGHPAADPVSFTADDEVRTALGRRNDTLARFWLDARTADAAPLAGDLAGLRALVVDAEDSFTGMLAHQLRALGLAVTLRSYRQYPAVGGYDLVVAGPGPGDPESPTDRKMAELRRVIRTALAAGQPLLGICLGHQVLASLLGLPLVRKDTPYQGVQRQIDFFGQPELVGFYSTFTAVTAGPVMQTPYGPVEVSRDPGSGEVHALRGATFAGVQFHPESVLTQHGVDLLRTLISAPVRRS
jgi:phenazine biosynthesis protein phzE